MKTRIKIKEVNGEVAEFIPQFWRENTLFPCFSYWDNFEECNEGFDYDDEVTFTSFKKEKQCKEFLDQQIKESKVTYRYEAYP